jgi:hypothetical protein
MHQLMMGCREMELLCRHRATFDTQHRWKWLGEAQRWGDLAHRETVARYGEHPGPMTIGPNTIDDECRAILIASKRAGKRSPSD